MFDRVFTNEELEGAYRLQLAKGSATMSMRLNVIFGLCYFLAFYRLLTYGPLTVRIGVIIVLQLTMGLVHWWTATFLAKIDNVSLSRHVSVKAAVVLATMIAIMVVASWIKDSEVTFRGPFTTGLARASVIAFQQFPMDVASNMHLLSWLTSLFIGLERWLEVDISPHYTMTNLAKDMLKCTLFCGFLPALLTLWVETSERRRFLINWRRAHGAPPAGHVDVNPFWAKIMGIQ